ncbi:Listeria/Bacterioides repeat-containing protein [Arsukibacterium tuosuense]|uniref:Listeria/Bacterioides repeat-containing protein n=1 Tax=Arsukibacterium tuosuense TaxID=1323745 RepID=A0A285J356_9GAMM|nr:InlB B-repeat-containing protein [Arsukibacterium tuosuense]SNY54755.1 Listeria/Bacterioides repeat-containing protein [Arsukibacterium tuosuense]
MPLLNQLFKYLSLVCFVFFMAQAQANYLVSDAGEADANGIYLEYATQDGVPAYRKEEGAQTWYLYRCGGMWVIEPYDFCMRMYYYSYNNPDTPPATGWNGGPGPVPTVGPAGPLIGFSSKTLFESLSNDGRFPDTLTLTHNLLDGDSFSGSVGENLLATGKAALSNLPAGLSATLNFVSSSELELVLSGAALDSSQADNVSNLTLQFSNSAFLSGDASANINAETSDLRLQFRDLHTVGTSGLYASIAAAVVAASPYDILQLAAETFTEKNINLTKALVIVGAGAEQTIIQAMATPQSEQGRIFYIGTGLPETIIEGVTLRNGYLTGQWGGAIEAQSPLQINNSRLTNNRVESNSMFAGGAIFMRSTLTMKNTLVDGNSGHLPSSDRVFGGALVLNSSATAILINTTFTGNSITAGVSGTDTLGGAIGLYVTSSLTLINSTVTGNSSAGNGGGIGQFGAGGSVSLVNSIVSGNNAALSPATADLHIAAPTALTISHSIIGFRTESNDESIDNLITGDPLLAALADNGGASQTYALLPGSPAIGAGSSDADVPANDQRGYWRLGAVDMGAYQANGFVLTFDGNGADLGTPPLYQGAAIYPAENTLTKAEHSFNGWNTVVDGSGIAYAAGAAIAPQAGTFTLYAQWVTSGYTVTFQDWNGTLLKTETVPDGDSATAPAEPGRVGHSFTGWSPANFSSITADTVVTAQYSIKSYTVSFVDWNSTVLKTETVNHGSGATPPANPSRTGHSFTNWDRDFNTITANTTVTAQYSVNSFTLSFDSAGGSAIAAITANFGTNITAPATPTREGYTFAGWTPALPATMPASNVNVTAQWTVNVYTVSFDSAGGSAVAAITANFGTNITAPATPTREGYTFAGWTPALPVTMPASNVNVTAQWSQNNFTVTATLTGEGNVTPASQQVNFGNNASFALSVAEDTFVQIESNCAASRSGNQVITAVIQKDCAISLMVFAAVELEIEDSSPAGSAEARRFRLSEGAGEQVLTALQQTRSGTTEWRDISDADTLLTLQDDGSYLFSTERTGRYTFDFKDNISGEQVSVTFDVLPYIAFTTSSQPVQQDTPALARVWLSDEPIDYPVRVEIKGEQVILDNSLLELNAEDMRRQAFMLTATAASDSELTLLNDGLEQALLGSPHRQRLAIKTEQLPLVLKTSVTQDAASGFVIEQSGGLVELIATELNGVPAEFSWQATELELSASGASASFNPEGLASGRYYVKLTAEAGAQQGQLELALNVVADCPVADCSNSGVSGIPASQNPQAGVPNRLPLCPQGDGSSRVAQCLGQSGLYIEVPNQYQLTLGLFSEQQSWQSGQFGVALTEGSLLDTGYQHLGFLVNMDIIGLESPGESVSVAIPLPAGQSTPTGALWRKLVNLVWQDFVEDGNNHIESASRNALGNCPGVSSDSWRSGLNEGDACIRLTIEDGGPNDDDAKANGVIRDPGVLAVRNSYTLTFDANGGSTVAAVTQLYGSELDIAPPVREGHSFLGWSPALPATMPEQDITFVAQWQINQYQIRFDTVGGQALAPLSLNFGSGINAPTPVRQGYSFKGWNPILPQSMPAQDLQVTAQWYKSTVVVKSSGGSMQLLWLCGLLILTVRRYVARLPDLTGS